MAEVTRFYDRSIDGDGPVSGAIQCFQLHVPSVTNTSVTQQVNLPAGMAFEITDIMFTAAAIGATPKLQIGTAASGVQIVAEVSATTNLGALTICTPEAAGGDIHVTVIGTASDTVTEGNLTFVGHVLSPPTSVEYRG